MLMLRAWWIFESLYELRLLKYGTIYLCCTRISCWEDAEQPWARKAAAVTLAFLQMSWLMRRKSIRTLPTKWTKPSPNSLGSKFMFKAEQSCGLAWLTITKRYLRCSLTSMLALLVYLEVMSVTTIIIEVTIIPSLIFLRNCQQRNIPAMIVHC